MTVTYEDAKQQLLDAILTHVPFDGWSEESFRAAIADCDLDEGLARVICPRGAVDLALAFHARGDAEMLERLKSEDLSDLKFRDRIAAAVRFRLQAVPEDKQTFQHPFSPQIHHRIFRAGRLAAGLPGDINV